MDKTKLAVEPTLGTTIVANENEAQALRVLDDLELVLAGGGGDVVIEWG